MKSRKSHAKQYARQKAIKKYTKRKSLTEDEKNVFDIAFNMGWDSKRKNNSSKIPKEAIDGLTSALKDVENGDYITLVNDDIICVEDVA